MANNILQNISHIRLSQRAKSCGFTDLDTQAFPIYKYINMHQKINIDIAPQAYLANQKKHATIVEADRGRWISDPEFSIRLDEDEEEKAVNGDKEVLFTLAHELGHFTLHQPYLTASPSLNRMLAKEKTELREDEADYFAMHLLLPAESLRIYLKHLLNKNSYPDHKLLELASNHFLTPEEWVSKQLATINLDIEHYKMIKRLRNINF